MRLMACVWYLYLPAHPTPAQRTALELVGGAPEAPEEEPFAQGPLTVGGWW